MSFEPLPEGMNPSARTITNLQLRRAIREMGIFTTVDNYIRTSGDDDLIDCWDYANTFSFDDQRMDAICTALQVSKVDLFNLAFTK